MTALKKDNGALTEDTAVLLPGASNGNAESEERPRSSLYVQVLDEKIPLFLVKLWNIVDDPSYRHIVRWDDVSLTCFFFFLTIFRVKFEKHHHCRIIFALSIS